MRARLNSQAVAFSVGGMMLLLFTIAAIIMGALALQRADNAAVYGQLTTNTTSATMVAADVNTLLNGFNLPTLLHTMSSPQDNRLLFTGSAGTLLKITAIVSVQSNTTGTLFLGLMINGVVLADSFATQTVGTPNNAYEITTTRIYKAAYGDYFEAWGAFGSGATLSIPPGGGTLIVTN